MSKRVEAWIKRGDKIHTNNFTPQMWEAMGKNKNGWTKGKPPKDVSSAAVKSAKKEVAQTGDAAKLIAAADTLVKDGEFNAALTKYEQANAIKSTAGLLKKIESTKFKGLVAQGDEAFEGADYATALEYYTTADAIKTVQALTKKITATNKALEGGEEGDGDGDGLV